MLLKDIDTFLVEDEEIYYELFEEAESSLEVCLYNYLTSNKMKSWQWTRWKTIGYE